MKIILQHQEHTNGNDYPKNLRENKITPNTLILHIIDTFDARTHERAHQTLSKHPLLHAILKINNLTNQQFNPQWMNAFNHTLQQKPELTHD